MRRIFYVLSTAACILIFSSSFAQSAMFAKALDNNGVLLNGGSTAPGHVKEIEVLAWSYGMSTCSFPTTGCNPNLQDFSMTMYITPATITAQKMLLQGLHLTSFDFVARQPGALFDYVKIHMEDVIISSISEGGSGGESRFTVNMTVTPTRIAWQYTAARTDGLAGVKTVTGWDVSTNTEFIYVF